MRRAAVAIGLLILIGSAFGSGGGSKKKQTENRGPVRLAIRHADPWMVKAMLEGQNSDRPELSTVWATGGSSRNNSAPQNGGGPLLQDGYLVVNPTDNSLWWYPKKTN